MAGCVAVSPLVSFLQWSKPGARPEDYQRDRCECIAEAERRLADAGNPAEGESVRAGAAADPWPLGNCLKARGWTIERNIILSDKWRPRDCHFPLPQNS